ncbi:MAG: ATP-dependent DNA helicase RecG [Phycisphaerae bacterium]
MAGEAAEAAHRVLSLDAPVQFAHGVGPKRAELFRAMGVETCGDLLNLFPRDYAQSQGHVHVAQLQSDQLASIEGEIIQTRAIRRRPARFEALLQDPSGRCVLTWFNQMYMAEKLAPGMRVRASGKVKLFNARPQMLQPRIEFLTTAGMAAAAPELKPVYAASGDLTNRVIASIMEQNLPLLLPQIQEWVPVESLAPRQLLSRRKAYELIHRPGAWKFVQSARHALAFHEFLLHQLAVGMKRHHQQTMENAKPLRTDDAVDRHIRALLPFSLTAAQERVITQLRHDLAARHPMNRLVQGDVGSGKTVVALYAMLSAVAAGAQAALLAPTEVLAQQHLFVLERFFANSRVQIALLSAAVSEAEKKRVLAGLADGSIGLVIGTHAILRANVNFKNLAMLVVDEQHKFGVQQRALIRGRYAGVHTLVMTATPIPRTLAMAVFGDLDVSTIDALPPGRQGIVTRAIPAARRAEVYAYLLRQVQCGRQGYVVLPAIDENAAELRGVTRTFKDLQNGALKNQRVGILHGRMDPPARRAIMEEFRGGQIDVLVCTTIIEVGVDVPNATVMVIEHAERFGLAQLHQLRGRVGRSSHKSACILLFENDPPEPPPRLAAMIKYAGGFDIAQEDLKIRGMGEIVGERQSGRPDMLFPDLLLDPFLLPAAREQAQAIIKADPHIISPEHGELRKELLARFREALPLADVG